jgi:hypothetical protein
VLRYPICCVTPSVTLTLALIWILIISDRQDWVFDINLYSGHWRWDPSVGPGLVGSYTWFVHLYVPHEVRDARGHCPADQRRSSTLTIVVTFLHLRQYLDGRWTGSKNCDPSSRQVDRFSDTSQSRRVVFLVRNYSRSQAAEWSSFPPKEWSPSMLGHFHLFKKPEPFISMLH